MKTEDYKAMIEGKNFLPVNYYKRTNEIRGSCNWFLVWLSIFQEKLYIDCKRFKQTTSCQFWSKSHWKSRKQSNNMFILQQVRETSFGNVCYKFVLMLIWKMRQSQSKII